MMGILAFKTGSLESYFESPKFHRNSTRTCLSAPRIKCALTISHKTQLITIIIITNNDDSRNSHLRVTSYDVISYIKLFSVVIYGIFSEEDTDKITY